MLNRLLIIALTILLPAISFASEKWNHWYTVTILPNTPYAYYHESAQTTKGRLHFKTEMWKKEEGFINAEQLGVFSVDNLNLTPLFYNFHANYRESEITIDGSTSDQRLQIRIRRNEKELPIITRGLPSKAFFSSLFPIWMSRKLKEVPSDKAKSQPFFFLAILEDNQDAGFSAQNGRFQLMDGDEFSKKSSTVLVQVEFNGQKSSWYLDSTGAPLRIEIPAQNTRVERVTEKKAKAFLTAP